MSTDLEENAVYRLEREKGPPIVFSGRQIAVAEVLDEDIDSEYERLELYELDDGGGYLLYIVTMDWDGNILLRHAAQYESTDEFLESVEFSEQLRPLYDAMGVDPVERVN